MQCCIEKQNKAIQILYDPTHPLNEAFQKLPSGRRINVPLAKKNLIKKSFIPSAILILNANLSCTFLLHTFIILIYLILFIYHFWYILLMLLYCVLSRNILRNITCLFSYLFIIYNTYLYT